MKAVSKVKNSIILKNFSQGAGNSIFLCVPKHFMDALGWSAGEQIAVILKDNHIEIRKPKISWE